KKSPCRPVLKAQVKDLADIQAALKAGLAECNVNDVTLTLDVFETKGSQYYKGLAFSLFAGGVRGELGRGGHYGVQFGADESKLTATGFTLYMDTIRKGLNGKAPAKRMAVLPGYSWTDVQALQKEGWVTTFVKDKKEAAGFDQVFESKRKG
ncbi:MAG: ATP phosphoribosyltransferase regulatory subunit, partial [Alphaproteobacteria bacterium]|nr:ATP phosphoribosyltransferase regulatory subunit [Alphaproteobacteria bacterium]